MDEMYQYLKERLQDMYEHEANEVTIDSVHFFLLYQMLCHMKQIREIVRQEDGSGIRI